MKAASLLILSAVLYVKTALAATNQTGGGLQGPATDYMIEAFDDLAAHFEGNRSKYPRPYYTKLVACFNKDGDEDLHKSQIGAWKGMADYWKTNGTARDYMNRTDFWGECLGRNDARCYNTEYTEYNESKQEYIGRNGILIYEPCNHVSNLAFLHGATKVCDYPNWSISAQAQRDQKRSFASLAAGSAFFHGSHTYVGYAFDNQMIAVISYLAHQSSINFIANGSNTLTYLQDTKRTQTSSEVVDAIVKGFHQADVPTWAKILDTSDFPHDYWITFAAIVSTLLELALPHFLAYGAMWVLVTAILHDKDQSTFMKKHYLPEIGKATANVHLPLQERLELFQKLLGVSIKMLFAFLYQEKHLVIPGFKTPYMIRLGGYAVPFVNLVADGLTGFAQTDDDVNNSVNVYPGQRTCKYQQGHSIWHEMSSNGLLDLVYLCDHVFYLTKKYSGYSADEEEQVQHGRHHRHHTSWRWLDPDSDTSLDLMNSVWN